MRLSDFLGSHSQQVGEPRLKTRESDSGTPNQILCYSHVPILEPGTVNHYDTYKSILQDLFTAHHQCFLFCHSYGSFVSVLPSFLHTELKAESQLLSNDPLELFYFWPLSLSTRLSCKTFILVFNPF